MSVSARVEPEDEPLARVVLESDGGARVRGGGEVGRGVADLEGGGCEEERRQEQHRAAFAEAKDRYGEVAKR